MLDPHTRESRGFAFVTMESGEEADAAIAKFNATPQFKAQKILSVEKVSSNTLRNLMHYIEHCLLYRRDVGARGRRLLEGTTGLRNGAVRFTSIIWRIFQLKMHRRTALRSSSF